MNATLLFLALLPGSPLALSDAELLASAERAFTEGTELRHDSAKAHPAFARAASGYDELWRRGHHNPELALNRAKAHRLAGNLPGAIAALNEGLAVARWNRPLQAALEEARAAVEYAITGDLAAQCRQSPAATVGTRISPVEAGAIAGLLWLLACGGIARFAMTHVPGWLLFAGVSLIGLAVLGGLWIQDSRQQTRENEYPLVVLAEDVLLRKGNSEGYPARLEPKLPRGVEARKLTERGGWLQVRLAGGAVGWVPGTSVMSDE
jgi:hypothetical protein